jgi:hypothetical protein
MTDERSLRSSPAGAARERAAGVEGREHPRSDALFDAVQGPRQQPQPRPGSAARTVAATNRRGRPSAGPLARDTVTPSPADVRSPAVRMPGGRGRCAVLRCLGRFSARTVFPVELGPDKCPSRDPRMCRAHGTPVLRAKGRGGHPPAMAARDQGTGVIPVSGGVGCATATHADSRASRAAMAACASVRIAILIATWLRPGCARRRAGETKAAAVRPRLGLTPAYRDPVTPPVLRLRHAPPNAELGEKTAAKLDLCDARPTPPRRS